VYFVYVAELYPTEVRSLGFGWTSVVGMLGSTISPFIGQFASSINVNPWFPTAAIGLITWAFIFCLK
jgi:MFS family permease